MELLNQFLKLSYQIAWSREEFMRDRELLSGEAMCLLDNNREVVYCCSKEEAQMTVNSMGKDGPRQSTKTDLPIVERGVSGADPTLRRSRRVDYPDDDIKLRVARFLGTRHFSNFREFDVEVLHGKVTLTGEVDSYYEKQVAMTSTQHVAGVLALVDHIHVRKPK